MGFTNAQSRLLQDAWAWKSSGTTKTPFYDRDLNNFRLLFDLRVIEVGVIVTRASNLQAIFRSLGPKAGNKCGASTTHMEKLLPRIEGGGGGGCPILAVGITSANYVEDNAPI